jgi:tetratricopeptide (TPR) repeat protein
LLLTVVAAQLAAVGRILPASAGQPRSETALRFGGAIPIGAAMVLVVLAGILFVEGQRMFQIDQLRRAAAWLQRSSAPERFELAVDNLLAAEKLQPNDAEVQARLARAYLDLHDAWLSSKHAKGTSANSPASQADRLALEHYLAARDLCPLLPVPHLRIAQDVGKLQVADPMSSYLARAKTLAPADPQLWYLCGKMELVAGEDHEAWRSWRRCLELSDQFLTTIVDEALKTAPVERLWQLLPDRPSLWRLTAFHLFPRPEDQDERRPLLQQALTIYGASAEPLSATELHEKAALHRHLDQLSEAIAALEAALTQEPREVAWRFELARVLIEQGRFDDARRHLVLVLDQQPRHLEAPRLLELLARQKATGNMD